MVHSVMQPLYGPFLRENLGNPVPDLIRMS